MREAQYSIRPAQKRECRRIAELYRISAGGVADYIWTKVAQPGEDILDVGRRRHEREGTPMSYENCKMVDLQGSVVGILVAFPRQVSSIRRFKRWARAIYDLRMLRTEPDPVLVPYNVLKEDESYYIYSIAVDPEHRGKGIGTGLLAEAEKSCRQLGLRKLSLIVFDQNVNAKRLYEQTGYVEKGRHPVVLHPLIHYTGDVLLMVKKLA